MSLNWLWKDKCGEAVVSDACGKEFTVELYQGNAFLIFIRKYKETDSEGVEHNMYSLWSFFADEGHAKNCLGLNKGYTNMFLDNGDTIKKIRLDKSKHSKAQKLIGMLVKAFDEITIELYKEDNNNESNKEV